jgi:hypothetical protein
MRCACNSPHLNTPNHQVIATVVESEVCVFIPRTVKWTAGVCAEISHKTISRFAQLKFGSIHISSANSCL